jgi:hypothetical protein
MLTLLLDGELCKAPIDDNTQVFYMSGCKFLQKHVSDQTSQKVVDIGTGTGTWAM